MDISVYMPVYNGEEFIKRCIDSVLSSEFNGEFEFVIVDDGSEDKTVELIESYDDSRIKLFKCEHKGIVDASNFALAQCSGKYIARIDCDDTMTSDRLQKQYDFLESHKEYGMCHCGCRFHDGKRSFKHLPMDFEITHLGLLLGVAMVHSFIMYRSDLNLSYDKEYEWAEDIHLYLKASYDDVKIYNIKDVLCHKYFHKQTIGATKSKAVKETHFKVKKYYAQLNNKKK